MYADGTVVHQDEFDERDNGVPYYDDYEEYKVPYELENYLRQMGADDLAFHVRSALKKPIG